MSKSFEDYITGLELIRMENLPIYHSIGSENEAKIIGMVANEAYGYIENFLRERPEIILFVLNERDWGRLAPHSQPYGNPFVPDVRLFYGVRPPESWKDPRTLLSNGASADLKKDLLSMKGSESNTVRGAIDKIFTLDFFAATVAHEMAHPFFEQNLVLPQPIEQDYALRLDAFWIGEFLPQYVMYSFLQATDKSLSDGWLTLMKTAYEGGRKKVRYTNLSEMGTKYLEMVRTCIENIYWYQAKLFVMSSELYDHHAEDFLIKAKEELKLSEDLLINQLERAFGDIRDWLQSWR